MANKMEMSAVAIFLKEYTVEIRIPGFRNMQEKICSFPHLPDVCLQICIWAVYVKT